MKKFSLFVVLSCLGVAFTSCEKDPVDPVIPNEEELITTLKYVLTPISGGDSIVFSFQDLDGDGGNDPIIQGGVLDSNTLYTGVLRLLNELETPAESISKEVREEAEEHQFFFINSSNNVLISYSDQDMDNLPLGLETRLETQNIGLDSLRIILRHEPNKFAVGVKDGDITNAGGETDIEVLFKIKVE